ncbi:hypothetical protein F5884DRAFT_758363 [Xylogone sp. PMI_703]|nr:hypothetical protein F5884DRAFT_758363 [Xylogone sp. PMI_703]
MRGDADILLRSALKMQSILWLFTIIALGMSSPTRREYHYRNCNKEIQRLNHSTPITWNEVPIGTNALDSFATPGTLHSVSSGHHFFQSGWHLTNKNGGSWEYIPRNDTTSGTQTDLTKRQSNINYHEVNFIMMDGNTAVTLPTYAMPDTHWKRSL